MKLEHVDGKKKTGKIWLEAGVLLAAIVLLAVWGIGRWTSYGYNILSSGNDYSQAFVREGGIYSITYLNRDSIYLAFLSVVFSFLGNKEEIVFIVNLILQLGGVGCFYLGCKRISKSYFPLFAAVGAAIINGCFYSVISDSSMQILWFLTALIFWGCTMIIKGISTKFLKWILIGIMVGISSYVDLSGAFLLILFGCFVFTEKENKIKNNIQYFVWYLISSTISYGIMFCLWNNYRMDFVVFGEWFRDRTGEFFHIQGLCQYISLAGALLAVAVYSIVVSLKKESTTPAVFEAEQFLILQEEAERVKVQEDSEVEQQNSEMQETYPDEIFSEEIILGEEPIQKPKPIKFIENPLPLPKKHVKKEMNYAFEPTLDQMHYDYNNYRFDDDYDLKDN